MSLPFFPQPKPGTKLADKTAEKREDEKQLAQLKREVWQRDEGRCTRCKRKVIRTLALVPNRGEVHHTLGRRGKNRYLLAAAVLLCSECHGKITRHEVKL